MSPPGTPEVSVVMPSYGHARFVAAAMRSVLDQTFGDLELVVVDDGSRDASPTVISALAAADPRVVPVLRRENRGISATFNEGVAKARGRWIGFLASDDLWRPEKLERQLAVLAEAPEAVVYSDAVLVDAAGRPSGGTVSQRAGLGTGPPPSGDLLEGLLGGNFICLSSALLARRHLDGLAFDPELRYLNDYRLLLELARRHPFRALEPPLLLYRIHGRNVSLLSDRGGWSEDARRFRRWVEAELGEHHTADSRRRLDRTLAYLARL